MRYKLPDLRVNSTWLDQLHNKLIKLVVGKHKGVVMNVDLDVHLLGGFIVDRNHLYLEGNHFRCGLVVREVKRDRT